jgi:hypothetical protein
MKFCTTKNPVFCPMGLRRAMQSALAIVATLALVSSAQAQTYTWQGLGTSNSWFQAGSPLNWSPFLPPPGDLTTTHLMFSGTTRPDSILDPNGSTFYTNSVTFNTGVDFSITFDRRLVVGSGGIDNQVAKKQTFAVETWSLSLQPGTVNVTTGGEILVTTGTTGFGSIDLNGVVEKTGGGTLTLSPSSRQIIGSSSLIRNTAGTTILNGNSWGGVEVVDGVVTSNYILNQNPGYDSLQSGGVFNFSGDMRAPFTMTGGTMNITQNTQMSNGLKTFSGGMVAYSGDPLGGFTSYFGYQHPSGSTGGVVTISGGSQNFGAGRFSSNDSGDPLSSGITDSVLVTGGTSTGYWNVQGVTNDGGSITFTANTEFSPAYNTAGIIYLYDPETGDPVGEEILSYGLTLTSGTVSIGTVAGGGTAIGSLVNGTIENPLNTFLGAGNTLKLDLNQDLTRDLLITSGTLNWGGNVALNLTNLGEVANGSSWTFFNDGVLGNTGAFTGTLDGISLSASSIYNGLTFSKSGSLWTSTATGGGQQFTFEETTGVLAVVPEPSSIAVVGMGLAMLGWRRLARRRRAAA